MFGLFKSRDSGKDPVKAAIIQEFDQMIAVARLAPLSKQARVGKGIVDALALFSRSYTKEGFARLPLSERRAFIDKLAVRQEELRTSTGDVSIEHIGYSLVSRWLIAVAMNEDQLVSHFDESMLYFKRTAQSL